MYKVLAKSSENKFSVKEGLLSLNAIMRAYDSISHHKEIYKY